MSAQASSTRSLQQSQSSGHAQDASRPFLATGLEEPGPRVNISTPPKSSYGITTISDPLEALADIVFVHGMMGSSHRTWYHEKGKTYWPKDLLSVDLPQARIMAFGYDVNVWHPWNQVSQEWITGYATDLLGSLSDRRATLALRTRPLVFIAHSLGGLVVQKALTMARESRNSDWHLRCLETYTIGLLFLGTPHRGASLATWGERLARVLNIVKPVNSQILGLLEPRSRELLEMRRSFHNLLERRKEEGARVRIVCFYETIPTFKSCVVSEESATIDGEANFPISANHMDMAKFTGAEDSGYRGILRELRQIVLRERDLGYLCPTCERRWRADLTPGALYFCPFCGQHRSDWDL
ncbi:putative ribonuclease p/mrp subunit [Aspergillus japonicus CBS 114.51]|uniref:Putative ribonuclease p/mrp subunit n=1 Tax=Aspergillus japonicus CBS 114.51 TaxID=1448312 RepID=A0A8T8WTI8_ASPJA|nr:putative ribonuclease p/mrp subunit [Aspergillus japonicus CBS 114.51]RAH78649.1 putative ribonuclease p/mrp subunit [Aspergillus japonicus CBS 114.51]